MSFWKSGDVAIIASGGIKWLGQNHDNETCTLIEFIGEHSSSSDGWVIHDAWKVNGENITFWVNEKFLRKPYDGHELCSWEDCVFQPKELVVTT